MDRLSPSIPNTPPPELLNTFSPINRPDSTHSNSHSNSTSTTREAISRNSNSTNASNSPAIGNLGGTPVSFMPSPTLPPYLRARILSHTPGTSSFSAETRTGTVHPARATQLGRPAATVAAADERRNPQRLNAPTVIRFQNPVTIRLLSQNRFQHKPYFFPAKSPPKRTD